MGDMYYSSGASHFRVDNTIHGSLMFGGGSRIDTPIKDLAIAIVTEAVRDYVKVIRRLWKPGLSLKTKRKYIQERLELEEFFFSSWYEMLCDIDPESLLINCRKRAEEKEKEAIQKHNQRKVQKLTQLAVAGKEADEDGDGTNSV